MGFPMIVVMTSGCSGGELAAVKEKARSLGLEHQVVDADARRVVMLRGLREPVDMREFLVLPGVERVVPLGRGASLFGAGSGPEPTAVRVGDAVIGGGRPAVIAGPCAVESLEQALTIASVVRESGAMIFRGGAYKPRTSPYDFQGLGEEGLKILARVRDETGLMVVTEALDAESLELVARYADMIQIGSRNMQNYPLLRRAGRLKKPILLKRGMAATLDEWLMAAEYILSEGCDDVVLCERGVRTFSDHSRFTLDLAAVPAVRERSRLPVIVDPSHGTGVSSRVPAMARAAVAAGADGVMLEVHYSPEQALSDGQQTLTPEVFLELVQDLKRIAEVIGKPLP